MRMPATAKTMMTPTTIPTTAPVERPLFADFSTWDWLLPVRPGSGTAVTVWTVPPTVTVWTDGAVGLVPSLFGCVCLSQRCLVKAVSPSKVPERDKNKHTARVVVGSTTSDSGSTEGREVTWTISVFVTMAAWEPNDCLMLCVCWLPPVVGGGSGGDKRDDHRQGHDTAAVEGR